MVSYQSIKYGLLVVLSVDGNNVIIELSFYKIFREVFTWLEKWIMQRRLRR